MLAEIAVYAMGAVEGNSVDEEVLARGDDDVDLGDGWVLENRRWSLFTKAFTGASKLKYHIESLPKHKHIKGTEMTWDQVAYQFGLVINPVATPQSHWQQ